MSFTIKVRGASTQPIMQDFLCDNCGPITALASRGVDGILCPDGCGSIAHWVISAPFVGPERASVVRGPVEKPAYRGYLDTRALGEGQSMREFKADRVQRQHERRKREAKDWK